MIYRKDFLGFSGVTGKILIELSQTRLANTQYQLFLEILKEFLLFSCTSHYTRPRHGTLSTSRGYNGMYTNRSTPGVDAPSSTLSGSQVSSRAPISCELDSIWKTFFVSEDATCTGPERSKGTAQLNLNWTLGGLTDQDLKSLRCYASKM